MAQENQRLNAETPIPPPELHELVTGNPDLGPEDFLAIGRGCAQGVLQILTRNNIDLDSFGAILDFGCGCGRVIRHMDYFKNAEIYGTDYDARLVDWCKANLPFANFGLNQLRPPLKYKAKQFDFVYAFSVLTHWPENLSLEWLGEFSRVLKPGGYLYFTTQGQAYADFYLSLEDKLAFNKGRPVVLNQELAGEGKCNAFLSSKYVTMELARDFEIVELVAGAVVDISRRLIGQDSYLLRNRYF